MDLDALVSAAATTLRTELPDWNVHTNMAQLSPPCIVVTAGDINYNATFENTGDLTLRVDVFAGSVSTADAFTKLYDLIAPDNTGSVVTAMLTNRTLGGACSDMQALTAEGPEPTELPDLVDPVLVARVTFAVLG